MHKILSSAVMMLAVASSASVEAAVAYSWNLSHDMMSLIIPNPFPPTLLPNPFPPTPLLPNLSNVWTAMYDPGGTSHTPGIYQPMPTYDLNYGGRPFAVWNNTNLAQNALLVGVATQTYNANNGTSNFTHIQGIPTLHPGPTFSSIIGWQSPINGNVNIMGRIADVDSACGNGINWFVDKGNFTLMSGTLANGNNGATILQQNIPVSIGTYLYFIVSPKSNNNLCDTTYLDIIITNP